MTIISKHGFFRFPTLQDIMIWLALSSTFRMDFWLRLATALILPVTSRIFFPRPKPLLILSGIPTKIRVFLSALWVCPFNFAQCLRLNYDSQQWAKYTTFA